MTEFTQNFTSKDFPVGTPHPVFVGKLQAARDFYGKPIIITSGGRTIEHNSEIGGVWDSSHIIKGYDGDKFRAADILCETGMERWSLVAALMDAGFKRMGVYSKHIHVDDDPTKVDYVIWVG